MAEPQVEQIVAHFKTIRNIAPQDNPVEMWDSLPQIRELATKVLGCLGTDETLPLVQDLQGDNASQLLKAIHDCAIEMTKLDGSPDAHVTWRAACVQIIHATRRAEELLQPLFQTEVLPSESAESDVLTHPTAQSHAHARVVGSVTQVTWSAGAETRTQGEIEAADLPEATTGELTARMQRFEQETIQAELRREYGPFPGIGALGFVSPPPPGTREGCAVS